MSKGWEVRAGGSSVVRKPLRIAISAVSSPRRPIRRIIVRARFSFISRSSTKILI